MITVRMFLMILLFMIIIFIIDDSIFLNKILDSAAVSYENVFDRLSCQILVRVPSAAAHVGCMVQEILRQSGRDGALFAIGIGNIEN